MKAREKMWCWEIKSCREMTASWRKGKNMDQTGKQVREREEKLGDEAQPLNKMTSSHRMKAGCVRLGDDDQWRPKLREISLDLKGNKELSAQVSCHFCVQDERWEDWDPPGKGSGNSCVDRCGPKLICYSWGMMQARLRTVFLFEFTPKLHLWCTA